MVSELVGSFVEPRSESNHRGNLRRSVEYRDGEIRGTKEDVMRNVTLALIAVAVLAIAGGTQAALRRAEGQAPSQDGKSQFKLGVVNLKVCFDKDRYKRVKDIDAELEKKREEFEKKVRDIENHISELNSKLDSLPGDNSLRPEIYLQLGRAQSDRKFEQEYGRTMFLRFYSDRKTDVYNDIRRAVTSVAEAQKFDLVLRVEAP